MLTAEQTSFFQKNGYLVLESVLSADEVVAMRAEVDDLLATILNSSSAQVRTSGRLDWRRNSGGLQRVA